MRIVVFDCGLFEEMATDWGLINRSADRIMMKSEGRSSRGLRRASPVSSGVATPSN